ncbi:MAG: hypothetical protein WC753_01135 [Candidatus Gracilibacteria bacterium]
MLIRIVGEGPDAETLFSRVQIALEELGLLSDAILERYDTPVYREELHITTTPALCIEESSIDFRDMIFEGVVPEQNEVNNVMISLFGTGESSSSCGTCSGGSCDACSG